MRRIAAAALVVLATLGAWRFWPAEALPARFAADDCHRVALVDARTGREIVGVEDIALADGRLWLSAYDRLAAEGGGNGAGGIYAVAPAALAHGARLRLESRTAPGRHPHGIAAAPGRLAVINRQHRAGRHTGTALRLYGRDGGRLSPAEVLRDARLCAANDVAFEGGVIWVTLDRGACPGLSARDALWPARRGRLLRVSTGREIEIAAAELTFPNGVAPGWGGTWLAVAETRARRIALDPLGQTRRIAVPGAPDNLSAGPAGGLVAALHPDLLRLAAYRHGWTSRAPSRVVRIGLEGGIAVLFDDPDGSVWPGATVAVPVGRGLVLGSVRAPGVLVCGEIA